MLPGFLVTLAGWVQPWADLYSDSTPVQTGVTFAHLGGLLGAGGFAVASDRLALRASRAHSPGDRDVMLRELAAVHRPVLIGLSIVTATGILMALADLEFVATSLVFWLKMAAFVALLANGLTLLRVEERLENGDARVESAPAWKQLRAAAQRSMALWAVTLLLGTLLTEV